MVLTLPYNLLPYFPLAIQYILSYAERIGYWLHAASGLDIVLSFRVFFGIGYSIGQLITQIGQPDILVTLVR
jgi:hypothetical protein